MKAVFFVSNITPPATAHAKAAGIISFYMDSEFSSTELPVIHAVWSSMNATAPSFLLICHSIRLALKKIYRIGFRGEPCGSQACERSIISK